MTALAGKVTGMRFSGRTPILIAIASQSAAIVGLLAAIQGFHAYTGEDLPLWAKLGIACTLALATALAFRADWRWAAFLGAVPALFYFGLALSLPAWVPLVVLAVLIVVFWNVISDRVPLYLTNDETVTRLLELLPSDRPVRFIDLGCGTGTVPIALAALNADPNSRFEGVENAPLLYLGAKLRTLRARDPRIRIRYGSIWKTDLSEINVAYAFLSPHPMKRLFEYAENSLPKDAMFVSNSFEVPGKAPDKSIPLTTGRATELLVWYMRDGRNDAESTRS